MVWENNQNVFLIQIDGSSYSEFEKSDFEIQSTLAISNSDPSNSSKLEASIWFINTFWLLSQAINLASNTFFTSPNYPKCKLICTSGNLNLEKKDTTSSRYRGLTVILFIYVHRKILSYKFVKGFLAITFLLFFFSNCEKASLM